MSGRALIARVRSDFFYNGERVDSILMSTSGSSESKMLRVLFRKILTVGDFAVASYDLEGWEIDAPRAQSCRRTQSSDLC